MPSPPSSNIDEVLKKAKHPEYIVFSFYFIICTLSARFPNYLENIRQIVENLRNRDAIGTTGAECFRSLLEFLRQTADFDLINVFNDLLKICGQGVQFLVSSSPTQRGYYTISIF